MRIKNIIVVCFLSLMVPEVVFASGAAARRNRPVQVRPQVQTQQIRQTAPRVLAPSRGTSDSQERQTQKRTSAPSQVLISAPQKRERASTPQVQPVQDTLSADPLIINLLNSLDQSSEAWMRITDIQLKEYVVARYINLYRQFGIEIRKPPIQYVALVDSLSRENSTLLRQPFDQILRMIAIIEYDYFDGQNQDILARSILNPQDFITNKQRLGIP